MEGEIDGRFDSKSQELSNHQMVEYNFSLEIRDLK